MYQFIKPYPGKATRFLFVGNVHGLTAASIENLFERFGPVQVVLPPDTAPASAGGGGHTHAGTGQSPAGNGADGVDSDSNHHPNQLNSHCYVVFECEDDAKAALAAAPPAGSPWPAAGARNLVVKYADVKVDLRPVPRPVCTDVSALGVPGLVLLPEFVSPEEERELLAAVDAAGEAGWVGMAKRRVQHYGYAFDYTTRGVDCSRRLGPQPAWAAGIAQRISQLVGQELDQLTVNEYTPGVGLSPHIDTHSAFTGAIVSLSMCGHSVIVFRAGSEARPLLLPQRSLLVMGGESRFAWQHYIPHRKADLIDGQMVPRPPRRISLTFRQVRGFACDCAYPQHCDSQQGVLPPTRISQLPQEDPEQQQPPGEQLQPVPPADGVHSGPTLYGATTPHHHPQQQQQPQGNQPAACLPASATPDCGPSTFAGGAAAQDGPAPSQQQQPPPQEGQPEGQHLEGAGGAGPGRGPGGGPGPEPVDAHDASLAALEAEYVHKVYDAIAPHFSATRFAVWPKVRAFIDSIPCGGVVADVGCGNGKYFGVKPDIAVLGSDRSAGLVEVAARRLRPAPALASAVSLRADALVADGMRLPYRPASCDAVLCIAVLHHISSRARRVRMLRQLLRVLRPGGRALVTVWATQQEDPAKTLAKWHRIQQAPEHSAEAAQALVGNGSATGGEDAASEDGSAVSSRSGGSASPRADAEAPPVQELEQALRPGSQGEQQQHPCSGTTGGAGASSSSAAPGSDYFVPWHLPFHRVEAPAAMRHVPRAGGGSGEPAAPAGEASGAPRVDSAKGAVVFQRYYHLFEEGELDELVNQALLLPLQPNQERAAREQGHEEGGGAEEAAAAAAGHASPQPQAQGGRPAAATGQIVDSYYDRSNWCVVFERAGAEA